MQKRYNFKEIVLLILIALMFVYSFYLEISGEILSSVKLFMASSVFLFFFLVDLKQDRILKGIYLICFGMFIGDYLPSHLYVEIFAKESMDKELAEEELHVLQYLTLFKSAVLYACCGAGGSLIAVHSDKTSTDREDKLDKIKSETNDDLARELNFKPQKQSNGIKKWMIDPSKLTMLYVVYLTVAVTIAIALTN